MASLIVDEIFKFPSNFLIHPPTLGIKRRPAYAAHAYHADCWGAGPAAAARLAKQAGPDLSAVALSSPLGSTPRGRGVARVMGSPPQACASAKGRTNRHSWKLRATALAPSRRATASWEGSGSPEGGVGLLREPGGSCVDHAWPLCPGLLPLVFGQDWIELLTVCLSPTGLD